MDIRELKVPDSYEFIPRVHHDARGLFMEWYRFDELKAVAGRSFDLRQANTSVSVKGAVRGIHFADIPPSQAKYVSVTRGAVIDFVVDIRVGSPTFGTWDSVTLNAEKRNSVFLAEGLGHCFVALTHHATVSYLVTEVYQPQREHGITPFDEEIGLRFPFDRESLVVSNKDAEAPSLDAARTAGLLPNWNEARRYYSSLS